MLLTNLKIKLKALGAESRIIRHEELKRRGKHWASKGTQFYFHRIGLLRRTTRENHLAYGFLKGRTYRQLEQHPKTEPKWKNVLKHIEKFSVSSSTQRNSFDEWHNEAEPKKVPHVHKPGKLYVPPTGQAVTA